jgi:hypothetical protein
MSTAHLPNVKITLQHTSGAVSSYKAGAKPANEMAGGVKEAIVTCFGGKPGDLASRFELLRSDIPGADWTAMERAGAVGELVERLQRAGADLSDGHDPHVVVKLGEKGSFGNARLVTSHEQVVSELAADSSKRSLVVPRVLPYQLGGDELGAVAVVFKPAAGGGLRIHSMHPTSGEAAVAESNLKASGEAATMTIFVSTTVTELVKLVASGRFKKPVEDVAPKAVASSGETGVGAGGRAMSPGLKSPLTMGAPTPFAA